MQGCLSSSVRDENHQGKRQIDRTERNGGDDGVISSGIGERYSAVNVNMNKSTGGRQREMEIG